MTIVGIILAVLAFLLAWPIPAALARFRGDPISEVVLWQAVGLSGGLSLIGAALAFAVAPGTTSLPQGLFDLIRGRDHTQLSLLAWIFLVIAVLLIVRLLGCLVLTFYSARKTRLRHDEILHLLSEPSSAYPDTRIITTDEAVAYCLPKGPRKGTAVLSTGLLKALDEDERTAVIAHERAHLDFRHDVLVIPFAAWHRALPYFSATAIGLNSVNRLIELMADDQARDHVDPKILAQAVSSAAAISPEHRSDLSALRIQRLSHPLDPARIPVRLMSIGLAVLLLLLPTLLIVTPSAFGI
ncbi:MULTISPECIES: M56 family metallopeptidase [Brevibacterium]|jgi:Zn-dependent protease with chaperone function|uniref:Peptidase M56 n=2 Tax=Brevibacterium TaxID=1696 RepID=A0A142NN13_BRELN|nr:M56 family metallopeptidase [Brevibacterium linens]AMT94164.1 peptidase M56 [Brevibacterium linens]HHX46830.1 M56 family metallopeptidase [Brevibacterium sp.]HJE77194.1 M56 family metallopeptidase [Brevibacterium epidermidis]